MPIAEPFVSCETVFVKKILIEELPKHEAEGWNYLGIHLPPLGGWRGIYVWKGVEKDSEGKAEKG